MTATVDILRREGAGQAFAAGQTIFTEGETGDVMYVVAEGEIDVLVRGQVIETIVEGGIVGEMALIDANPRSATVVAKTDCTLVAVDSKRFERLVSYNPFFALQVMRILAQRLRRRIES
jgi:CRP/FNR family transcriptional regulator, cyclic AMP receptor protein